MTSDPHAVARHLQEAVAAPGALAELGPLDALFGPAPVGIAILRGPEHRILYANAVELDLWGREAAQVIGRTVDEALPELVEQGLIEALCDRVLRTGEPVIMTEQAMDFDRHGQGRRTAYFNAVHLPTRDAAGVVNGLMAIAWETTGAVVARRNVEALSRELASRIELEQHLIGIVSHDLRNPLNVILLSAQVLQARRDLSPPQAELVERIGRVTRRSIQLIRDLLDFTEARLGGRLPLHRRPTRLAEVLTPLLEQFEVENPGRVVACDAQDAEGDWDPARLLQALQNLVANAVQYSAHGSTVRVSSGTRDRQAWIAVHNTGTPIAADRMETLFDPMRRAHAAPNSATRNIGMGLYITEQIARAHGGRVAVSSDAGDGTRFTLWLPLGAAAPG